VTPWGYNGRPSPLRTPVSSRTIYCSFITSFPVKKKREKRGERKRKEKGNYRVTGSVASPSFRIHVGIRLGPLQEYAGSPTKPRKTRVHDGDGSCGLSRVEGPRVPRAHERIRGDLRSILGAGIWCAIAPVPPLVVATIWPGAAQSEPLRGPTYHNLCDLV
jgi:hypothetical protein